MCICLVASCSVCFSVVFCVECWVLIPLLSLLHFFLFPTFYLEGLWTLHSNFLETKTTAWLFFPTFFSLSSRKQFSCKILSLCFYLPFFFSVLLQHCGCVFMRNADDLLCFGNNLSFHFGKCVTAVTALHFTGHVLSHFSWCSLDGDFFNKKTLPQTVGVRSCLYLFLWFLWVHVRMCAHARYRHEGVCCVGVFKPILL